ncbi:uncharacterized protein TrAtP1_002030 [Trichoderma atroviride]|uniref:uncharacterized protein n=1 Tax=Hypocrea atroviridis TaxID=63577 RepID=UPI0033208C87|nr:hypothetical protein TrAtP1_002030 [Trichoderma atroviride]
MACDAAPALPFWQFTQLMKKVNVCENRYITASMVSISSSSHSINSTRSHSKTSDNLLTTTSVSTFSTKWAANQLKKSILGLVAGAEWAQCSFKPRQCASRQTANTNVAQTAHITSTQWELQLNGLAMCTCGLLFRHMFEQECQHSLVAATVGFAKLFNQPYWII